MKNIAVAIWKMALSVRLLLERLSGRKKKVLLFCKSKTMEEHILDYYKQVKDSVDVSYYLYYPVFYDEPDNREEFYKRIKNKKIHIIRNKVRCAMIPWNLVVSADLPLPSFCQYRDYETLYVNHGFHIVSLDGGKTLYTYSERCRDQAMKPQFSKMLEPNKWIQRQVINEQKDLEGIVEYVGYKYADSIVKSSGRYNEYRNKLGIQKDETFVMVFGSWDKESLFHVMGKTFFDEAKKMQKNDKFRFGLSIHPKEYHFYREGVVPMGELVEAQKSRGFIIRKPSQDWMPYMIAADIVFCDYSTMFELAILANKKIVISSYPKDKVWHGSLEGQADKIFPVIHNAGELREVLLQVKDKPINAKVQDYFSGIYNKDYSRKVVLITQELLGIRGRSDKE